MSSIYDWSTTPATNGAADAAMTWAEGMAPASVNNSARQLVARVAEILGDISGALTAGGTSSALTVTANSAFTTYANGRIIALKASVDNAASATLNVNGIGAKSIRKFTPTEAALAGAEMKNTGIYLLMYSTALNSAAGGWHLLTPSDDMTAFVTLTGSQTLTNKLFTTGNAFNGTLGATTPASVAGTTGVFSGAVSGTTGTFSGAISGTSGTFSVGVTSVSFLGNNSTSNVIIASADGLGTINLRPKGVASATDAVVIDNSGNMTINGTLTVTG